MSAYIIMKHSSTYLLATRHQIYCSRNSSGPFPIQTFALHEHLLRHPRFFSIVKICIPCCQAFEVVSHVPMEYECSPNWNCKTVFLPLSVTLAIVYKSFATGRSTVFVGWLVVASRPSNMLVYLRDGSAQTKVLPHRDQSFRSNFLPHPATLYWHRADQSKRWAFSAGAWQGSHCCANF